ncbi:hypothetical protein ACHAXM_011061 [Skeletonema potamos]
MTEDTTTTATSFFPTSATVPFPFDSPYDVQRDMMDAILASLRQCRNNNNDNNPHDDDEGNNDRMGRNNDDDDMLSSKKCKNNERRGIRRRAPIIMLESPTGTGKSMSLACASMAWLRYCEQADLNDLLKIRSSATTTTTANNSTDISQTQQQKSSANPTAVLATKKKVYDWIEAWQPPTNSNELQTIVTLPPPPPAALPSSASSSTSQSTPSSFSTRSYTNIVSATNIVTQPTKIATFALQNREALNKELQSIRSRLDRLLTIALTAAANNDNNNNNSLKEQERTLRENLVRSGVSSALLKDRKRKRKRNNINGVHFNSSSLKHQTCGGANDVTHNRNTKEEEEEFLVDEYHSDGDERKRRGADDLSSDSDDDDDDDDDNKVLSNLVGGVTPGTGLRKIIYAARTHSQLSQFIGELRRTKWGTDVKVVALGSRSLLCCNEDVIYGSKTNKTNSRRSEGDITELCLDMQKNKSSMSSSSTDGETTRMNKANNGGCPYLVSRDAISTLAMHSMVRPSDIEDMAGLGKASHACSYYASREALAAAEVVVLPYNTLLSPQARQSVGLSITNALIVIDEAHNIPETLRALSSCKLSMQVAEAALAQLLSYTRKYSGRLAGRNLFYLGQIRKILLAIIKYLKCGLSTQDVDGGLKKTNSHRLQRQKMIAAVDLMFTLKLDNINLFSILRYLKKITAISKVTWFSHAVILAGGTLRPFSHVAAELFGDDVNVMRAASEAEGQLSRNFDMLSSSNSNTLRPPPPSSMTQITPRLTTFTCGHVIPPNNVITACLSSGPTSVKLDFRHSNRSSNQMIDELGRVIMNMCNVVPSGFVVFLPSYNYESQVFQRWRATGMLSQIDSKKRIFREPKNSRDVEDALARYSSEASSPSKKGALLFSVMGGKMSEGINFANEMARCVLVAGLPFPDVTDPVLKEKMESLDRELRQRGTGINGQDYYRNLCMRTVNQSVGRAIRHSNDYAAIVLCDYRYSSEARIWHALPQWLRKGCGAPHSEDATFGKVMKSVRSFFAGR